MVKLNETTKTEEDQNYIYHLVDKLYEDIKIMFEGTRIYSDDDVRKYIYENIQATYGKRKRWRQIKMTKMEIYDEVLKELFGESHEK
jgi:hypothetical protein